MGHFFFGELHLPEDYPSRDNRDRVIPAEHLHNDRFIPKWKELCNLHGIDLMKL